MSELKRCPFCGGEAKIDCYLYFDEFDDWFIRCTSCFCRTRTFKTKKSAILTWNTRKPMKKIVERLEEELHLSYKEKERCVCEHPLQFDEVKGYARGIANAIEIVREEGGMK